MPGNKQFPGRKYVQLRRFFHPDYTVGMGVSPIHAADAARGLYRQGGFAPRPETDSVGRADILFTYRVQYTGFVCSCQCFFCK